jgi:hypothetical protein
MKQRRKNQRFYLEDRLIGEFRNHDKFVVKDINFEGLKIVSNFAPIIGALYLLFLKDNQRVQEIEVQVLEAQLTEFTTDNGDIFPAGALFSIRGKIENLDDEQRKFIVRLLENHFSHLQPHPQEGLSPSGGDDRGKYRKTEAAAYQAGSFMSVF